MTVPLFIDTYKSNNIKLGVNDMTVNESEMCEMKGRSLINTGYISPEIAYNDKTVARSMYPQHCLLDTDGCIAALKKFSFQSQFEGRQ